VGDDDDTDHEDGIEFVAVYVCTDPASYGHRSRWQRQGVPRPVESDKQRAEASFERRLVVANNKAWRSAEVVRRDWLAGFLRRKTAPKGAPAFVAGALARCDNDLRQAMERSNPLAERLLGASSGTIAGSVATDTDGRAQVVALGLVLAAYENGTGTHSWRNRSEATGRYLRYLEAQGYALAEVERLACGPDPTSTTDDEDEDEDEEGRS
jgi:ParB family chromosome partitioning protein